MLASKTFQYLTRPSGNTMLTLIISSIVVISTQRMAFTRSFRKVILTQDVDNLGFQGEWAFVKPGYAFNKLVPEGKALFATDPAAQALTFNPQALKLKQD